MKYIQSILSYTRGLACKYCGRQCSAVGAGTNKGTATKPMCERCYENGGDC